MKFQLLCALLMGVWLAPVNASESMTELTGQVRAAELAFAKTLADRDCAAAKQPQESGGNGN